MHDDDAMVGRLLTRREIVALLGMSGVAAMADPLFGQSPGVLGGALPACVVQPEQTEGPYFVDKMLDRSDIRTDAVTAAIKGGLPLRIAFTVSQVASDGTCAPLPGAQVDLWQCDAAGVYSGVKDRSFDTTGQTFLRGYQVTDAAGVANFLTIYPGWYQGRAVHVHFKIRTTSAPPSRDGGASPELAARGTSRQAEAGQQAYEFTSQLYFDEAVNDRVFASEPYSTRSGQRLKNEADGIFKHGGKQLILPVTERDGGYAGTFSLALNPGQPSRGRGRGRGVR